jgi:hypothetical protein
VISFRYHVVSIVAVFLALALGVVVGTTALNGPITTNLRQQVDSLKKERTAQAAKNDQLQQQAGNGDQFAQTFGARVVAGTLKGKRVVIIGMPNSSSSIKTGIGKQVEAAGGTVSGTIQFTSDFVDPKRASDIVNLVTSLHPIGLTLPQTSDPGALTGALFGYVLLNPNAQATDLNAVIAAYIKAQLITVTSHNVTAADLTSFVADGGLAPASAAGQTELSMVTQYQLKGGGNPVAAGNAASAAPQGLISLIRSTSATKDTISTVDDADTQIGQVTVALALAETLTGKTGAYGEAAGASSLFPSLPK